MRAEVSIDKLNSGRVEIAIIRQGMTCGYAQGYPSATEAREVLLSLGLNPELVDDQLEVLAEIRPKELVKFPLAEIPDEALRTLGFKAV